MKTVIRRAMVERWAPYQGADVLREYARCIRELDAEYDTGTHQYEDESNASEAGDSDAGSYQASETCSEDGNA